MKERGDWFCTASGRRVHVLDPKPDEIVIDDIAHALSNLCRFGGHSRDFYSVAQHSVIVSQNVPEKIAREALLHDAAEAYLGDVIRPLKQSLPHYREIEGMWEDVIGFAFALNQTDEVRAVIKDADMRALLTERRDVAPSAWSEHPWKQDEQGYVPFDKTIKALSPLAARTLFVSRWDGLNER